MQILGKRSTALIIAVAILMLTALGLTFALWDTSAVKAASGDTSEYANAKVGDIVTFGRYYQTGNKDVNDSTEYEKTPIEWIVVDKNERTGELTLMSKYILAMGSFFGNLYSNTDIKWGAHGDTTSLAGGNLYNQAYVDSTARAFLNNLERLDLGGDVFEKGIGYLPSYTNSTTADGLLSSVGFSNKGYWTGLYSDTTEIVGDVTVEVNKPLLDDPTSGFVKRADTKEIYYKRPINNVEYKNRPAARGFFDEAFNEPEKTRIKPKVIAGYTGHRWPDNMHDISSKAYVEGTYDKVWLPSSTELNIAEGLDWNGLNDMWSCPSDKIGSTVFDYFKNYSKYGFKTVAEAIKSVKTPFAANSVAMNYSIPVYNRTSETSKVLSVRDDMNTNYYSDNVFWTRTPSSQYYNNLIRVDKTGYFRPFYSADSYIGVRPCIILEY